MWETEKERNELWLQVTRLIDTLKKRMESEQNEIKVKSKMSQLWNFYQEVGKKQNVLLCSVLSWEECRRHTQWDEDTKKIFNGFKKKAEKWLSEIMSQVTSLVAGSAKQQGARMEDEITSRESISKVST